MAMALVHILIYIYIFNYLAEMKPLDIIADVNEVPDQDVRGILQRVSVILKLYYVDTYIKIYYMSRGVRILFYIYAILFHIFHRFYLQVHQMF